MLNVWLVTIGEPLPLDEGVRKLRTGLLADRLLARGHRVRWWVSAFEHQRKTMRFDGDAEISPRKGLTLNVLRGCGYEHNISLRRYADHRIVARKFRRAAAGLPSPDLLVAAMPCHHLAYEAVRFAKGRGVPAMVDVRDLWPDIFADAFPASLRFLAKRLLFFEDRKLRRLLRDADAVLAMSNGILRWALDKGGRTAGAFDRVFYLGYERSPAGSGKAPEWLKDGEARKLAVYVGTFGASYELPLVLEAARRFHREGRKDVLFVLAGAGEQEEALREAAGGLPNVVLPGWIRAEEIVFLLHRARLGIVPCRSVADAVPNKTFEYFSAGLPVVSSLEGEMAEAVEKHGMGLNYRPGDGEGLFRALKTVMDDPPMRERMSANAARFFDENGDADKIYGDYADHIEALPAAFGGGRKGPGGFSEGG